MATASQKERSMSEGIEDLTDASKRMGNKIGEQAKDAGHNMSEQAKSFASNIAEKAENATEAVGTCMESFGETVRDRLPKEGMIGSAGQTIGEKLESGGRYLEEKGLAGIGDDVTNLIRSNPVPALLVGIGLGFILAKVMRR